MAKQHRPPSPSDSAVDFERAATMPQERWLLIEIAVVIIVLATIAWWMLPGVYGEPPTTRMPHVAMSWNLAC